MVMLGAAGEGKNSMDQWQSALGEKKTPSDLSASNWQFPEYVSKTSSMHRLVTSPRRFPSLVLPQPEAITTLLAQKSKCNQMYSTGWNEQCQETTMEITQALKNKGEEVWWKG